MSKDGSNNHPTSTHAWAPRPGGLAATLDRQAIDVYTRIRSLCGGLVANHDEFHALIHTAQAAAMVIHVLERSRGVRYDQHGEAAAEASDLDRLAEDPVFDEQERNTLTAISALNATMQEAMAVIGGAAAEPDPGLLRWRLALVYFVIQSSRQRTGDPKTARWFAG